MHDNIIKIKNILLQTLTVSNEKKEQIKQALREDTHFVQDLGIDSITLQEFYMAIEDHFDISILTEDMDELISLDKVSIYIQQKLP